MMRAGWLLGLGLFLVGLDARAALTDSEQAQIVGLVRESAPSKATRVRSLLGRPDLTAAEIASPLVQAYRTATFDDQRARFSEELLYGVGAAASRDQLALGLTAALLARSDKILADLPHVRPSGALERPARDAAEAQRIQGFVSTYLANPDGHGDPSSIRDETRRALVDAYQAYVLAHQWLFAEQLGWSPLLRLRVQTALTLIDLGQGVVEPGQIADWLGLSDSRRRVFERLGILVDDGGTASSARLDTAIQFLEKSLPAKSGYSVWWLNKAYLGPLITGGRIAGAASFLRAEPHQVAASTYWSKDVAQDAKVDSELAEVALSVARMAVATAFEADPNLREAVKRAASGAVKVGNKTAYVAQDFLTQPEGSPQSSEGLSSPELFATHSLRVLLLDAPLTMKAAELGITGERDEPIEQVAVALSILARAQGQANEVVVPAPEARNQTRFSGLKIGPSGVERFTTQGHTYQLSRSADGELSVNQSPQK